MKAADEIMREKIYSAVAEAGDTCPIATLTFRDFAWRSRHHIASKHGAAAHPHWHSYRARFWFSGPVDQDWLVKELERVFGVLHGAALNAVITLSDTSDENVAAWLIGEANRRVAPCVRVMLENDGQRGAEVTR